MFSAINKYLEDPLLQFMYSEVRKAGAIKSISLDLTSKCNLRCEGCYYFSDGMNTIVKEGSEADFDNLILNEKKRGTNFVTVVGGEPSLKIERLIKLSNNFKISVATNGQIKIPAQNLEDISIGVAVWGNQATDLRLRGNYQIDVFNNALKNFKNDPRAFFYYTVQPDKYDEIEEVTKLCIENGNRVLFNFFSEDNRNKTLYNDSVNNFEKVNQEIVKLIEKYPEQILLSSYVSQVVTSGTLYEEKWGHDVCPNFSIDNELNFTRMKNGNPYSPHFKSYNADFKSTRKCCTRLDDSCNNCYDVWQHFAWIIINLKKHLGSYEEFTNWLSTTYLFYLINRLVDQDAGFKLLAEIQKRSLINNGVTI